MDMNKEVLERLDSLGDKLEKLGSHGYESLIKYTVTQGIIDLCSISILLSITAILWVALYKSVKKSNEGHSTLLFDFVDKNEKEISPAGCTVIIFAVTLSIISFLVLLIGLPIAIQEIFNPEGYLIKSTIDNLK